MPKPRNPTRTEIAALERAQARVYDAWEAVRPATREKRAREALAISPLCADAHVILAGLAPAGSPERLQAWEAAVAAGEAALGPRGFKEMEGEFWGWLETRPYMRARLGLAMELLDTGRPAEAAAHMQAMLVLNPGDNQGIRYILAAVLGQMGDDAALAALLDRYEDDDSAFLAWPRVLLAFRAGGDCAASRKARAAAEAGNKHVAALLTGAKPLPKQMPGLYGFGDPAEAALYVERGLAAWRATPGALEWLRAASPAPRRRKTAKDTGSA